MGVIEAIVTAARDNTLYAAGTVRDTLHRVQGLYRLQGTWMNPIRVNNLGDLNGFEQLYQHQYAEPDNLRNLGTAPLNSEAEEILRSQGFVPWSRPEGTKVYTTWICPTHLRQSWEVSYHFQVSLPHYTVLSAHGRAITRSTRHVDITAVFRTGELPLFLEVFVPIHTHRVIGFIPPDHRLAGMDLKVRPARRDWFSDSSLDLEEEVRQRVHALQVRGQGRFQYNGPHGTTRLAVYPRPRLNDAWVDPSDVRTREEYEAVGVRYEGDRVPEPTTPHLEMLLHYRRIRELDEKLDRGMMSTLWNDLILPIWKGVRPTRVSSNI